ncbi:MAG: hypothetical protein C0613_08420 [Desulfobulbaceae bacterium]|nr:MAG: hypothetical protein C0613_08420 [Desulfobulbaceae bacterium]
MNNEIISIHPNTRMTSLEIAELTNKNHFDVLRDIRSLTDQEAINESNFAAVDYKDKKGELRPMYQLDFQATMVLITGYDAKRRALVIDRWQKLERGEVKSFYGSRDLHDQLLETPVINNLIGTMADLMVTVGKLAAHQDRLGEAVSRESRRAHGSGAGCFIRFMDTSNVQAFVDHCCQIESGKFTTKAALYEAFSRYCRETAASFDSKPNFFAKLYRCLPQVSQGRVILKGARTPIVTGLALADGGGKEVH